MDSIHKHMVSHQYESKYEILECHIEQKSVGRGGRHMASHLYASWYGTLRYHSEQSSENTDGKNKAFLLYVYVSGSSTGFSERHGMNNMDMGEAFHQYDYEYASLYSYLTDKNSKDIDTTSWWKCWLHSAWSLQVLFWASYDRCPSALPVGNVYITHGNFS